VPRQLKQPFSVTAFFTNPVNNMPQQPRIDVVILKSEEIDLDRRKQPATHSAAPQMALSMRIAILPGTTGFAPPTPRPPANAHPEPPC
jgi:hypothetical protein